MRILHNLRSIALPMAVLGAALTTACNSGDVTAPDGGPSLAAATSGPLSVDSRSMRLTCNAGAPCTGGLIVHATTPVVLSYAVQGTDFAINNTSLTTCVQGALLTDSCFVNVKVLSTDTPGRREGTLLLSESTLGTSLTIRLSARLR